jgi:cytochrome c oxidase subunit 2
MVWGLILWVVVRYRKRNDDAPRQVRYNLPLEVLYTLAPFAIIGVLFFYTVEHGNQVTKMDANPQHTVNVVAQQWQWTFNYKDTVDGQQGVWETGTLDKPATLWLPVNESVHFDLTSPDVIHSFWVPSFYFKLDVIPGKTNKFELTPTKTGTFAGKCAELCGLYHSRMTFTVKVVSRDEYDAHLKELAAKGQTGAATGGADATTIPGTGGEK